MSIIGELYKLPDVVTRMNQSVFVWYLTGSRFFGHNTEISDWDFFGEDSPEKRMWLEQNGFTVESETDYLDGFNTVVYRHWTNVHVQLVQGAGEKDKVQQFLKDFPWTLVPKMYQTSIWDWGKVA